ncbi:MAG: hypothetical protein MNSN_05610 [Minisyncoccus archaeiphilus]|uniref:DUF333 domain-containing protein n=1 Tax=Minisyncoccus archaeiphilus TaxID=3238481 RepID=UPI002B08D5B3|nr:MAG: hypothetical protein MNSN_05610 [Candidatus Parcubacteria bacterium]
MEKRLPILIAILLSIPLIIIAKDRNSEIVAEMFSPGGGMYFTKEWSRSITVLASSEAEERLIKEISICNDKLIEIASSSNPLTAIKAYNEEIRKLGLALSSISINSDISDRLAAMIFRHREEIDSLLISEEQKSILKNSLAEQVLKPFLTLTKSDTSLDSLKLHVLTQDYLKSLDEIDTIISLSQDTELKEGLIEYQLVILKAASKQNLSLEQADQFKKRLKKIQQTDYYIQRESAKIAQQKEEACDKIAQGAWIDKLIPFVAPEEVPSLEGLKAILPSCNYDKIDQTISTLQVYEDTKMIVMDAKKYILDKVDEEIIEFPVQIENKEINQKISGKKVITNPDNPASAFCLRKGYKLEEIVQEDKTIRNCIIDVENICEEWSLYKGECKIKEKKK